MNNNLKQGFEFTAGTFSLLRKKFKPEDVFFRYQLRKWAKQNGYVLPKSSKINFHGVDNPLNVKI